MNALIKYYCFLLLLLPVQLLMAQSSCTQDDLLHKIGKWQKSEDFFWSQKNYSESMKPEIFKRIDKMQQSFYTAYPEPKGMEVRWKHQVYGTAPFSKSNLVAYSFWALAFEYACDAVSHQPVLNDETSNEVFAFVNHFNGYITFDTTLKQGSLYAALMPYRMGSLDGTDLFQTGIVRVNERLVIISRNGQLPYIPLTRKQYLTALKGKLEREKQSRLNRELQYRKTETDKARLIDYIAREFDPKLKTINDYLGNQDEKTLDAIAFVKTACDTKFIEEKAGGRMYAILNKGYFNFSLPGYIPQFMLVVWKWNDGEGPAGGLLKPVAPDMNACCRASKFFKESIEQHLPLEALREMLDK